MSLLSAKNITQKYGKKVAVDDISLTVQKGQLVAFLGPNGAGKSTTIKMLTGVERPTHGHVEIGGYPSNDYHFRKQIGIVFQNSILDGDLTVKQNLELRIKMYHHLDSKFIDTIKQELKINLIMNQKYNTLSGGQRRRVDIARALINKPKLLFLDEPTTGLDIQTRNTIWQFLNHLRNIYHLTIILTTHYLEETNDADDVYILDHGNIIAHNTVTELKKKYLKHSLTLNCNDTKKVESFLKAEWHPKIKGSQIQILMPDNKTTLNFLNQVNSFINDWEYRRGDMNDIFIALTGKEIR